MPAPAAGLLIEKAVAALVTEHGVTQSLEALVALVADC